MNAILKKAREEKGLKTREVAQMLQIDQALISKFESGTRKPTKEQIVKLAHLLNINLDTILVLWLKERILHEIKNEKFALEALKLVESELLKSEVIQPKTSEKLQKLVTEINSLLQQFYNLNLLEYRRITKQLDLYFTFECNSLNGNKMSFEEVKLIVNEGISITDKPMKEHLEIINFFEAIQYCKELIQKKIDFCEKKLLQIYSILTQEIEPEISNQQPDKTTINELKILFKWYEMSKDNIHPLILASETHLKIMQILPFRQYNNQIAFLIMNWILLQNKYSLIVIKSDRSEKENYIAEIEQSFTEDNIANFSLLMAEAQKATLEYALSL
ncbi:helix-turn-helix domain-containing protein [Flavobacterium agrisoli]|uniref:Helix-turn-helix domain-containing protein n=1 Tax=Flavobacterium agrisoli TaxID=2793066 RepID=A0A934UIA0_9FLAO|nr:helix-turn-helix domain-containing protein [Flavobacterium agrisoli]MBK0368597.1 helix-turn-helix domain-containing protein [Flavobacterium agrisoli]